MTAATRTASRTGPATGLIAQVLLLAVLAATAGLGAAGWAVGVACALTMAAALARGLARDRAAGAGVLGDARPGHARRRRRRAGRGSFAHDTPVALLVALAAVALALDAADGWVARRTGTATALGARFDGEVDAFLIPALSVYVAPTYGAWVLAIGAARYLFLAGEWLLPWMRAPLPRAPLAQGRRGDAGGRADGRGRRACCRGRSRRRSWPPRSPRSRRRSASARGGCGAAGTPRRARRRRARRGAHGPRAAARLGRARRAEPAGPPHPRRVRAAPARAARRRRRGRPAARHPAPRAGRASWARC